MAVGCGIAGAWPGARGDPTFEHKVTMAELPARLPSGLGPGCPFCFFSLASHPPLNHLLLSRQQRCPPPVRPA